ncbi:lipopolysaccharide kinase InaA family protein [Candidatus Accumulibacter vicinus]|uniref:lipopolysaccharide kinase InaA family protein n=1 Tax=Candidatus Accumulibacter vicinus TaxID=2954382 RepID=UPI0004B9063C|nr:lipopolysaccharide kinase InaA family protein [Candidatus Accumulibacter vicinus]
MRAASLETFEPAFLCEQGTVVRRSGSSEVRRVEIEVAGARQVLFLKKSWVTRWAQLRSRVFRGMFFGASQVRREFANLERLHTWQLTEATPVAFGEERRVGWLWRSFLITTGIPEPMSVDAFIRDVLPRLPGAAGRSGRRELLRQVARLTRVLHARQFTHGDLYWRNLVIADNDPAQLSLIDMPRGRQHLRELRVAARAADLAALDAPAPWFFRRTERLRFLLDYRQTRRLDADGKELIRQVLKLAEPMRRKQLAHVQADAPRHAEA